MAQGVLMVTGGSRGIGAATSLLAAERGHAVVVNYAGNVAAAERVAAQIHAQGGVAVAVRGDASLEEDVAHIFAAARGFPKPVVLLNGDDPHMRLSSVTPCNRAAARLATDHLIALGHERILFLLRPGRRTIGRRLEGWREALRNRGLKATDDMIVSVDDWLPELAAAAIAERVGRTGLDFTAILGAGDSLAMGALVGLQNLGFSVPDEVSVMGMDNLPQGAFLNPPLTTMQIPMREIGAAALDLLRDDVIGVGMPARRVELACHMVERQSTARAHAV
ncbi:MAG: LacI family DNA-binding transcriptional regulator [Devosia sp.]